jgi:Ca2+-binding RTX toxin-like protein
VDMTAPGLTRPFAPALAGMAALLAVSVVVALLAGLPGAMRLSPSSQAGRVDGRLSQLPLSFQENRGQAGSGIDFVASSGAMRVALDPSGASISLTGPRSREATIGVRMAGGRPDDPRAVDTLPGKVNYLISDDPSGWHTNIPTSARVRYPEVWPGVDVDWYGDGSRLEYDFRLDPGADASAISMRIEGARKLHLASDGALVLSLPGGNVRQSRPIAYQPGPGGRDPVRASFLLNGNRIGILLGPHDPGRALVIDPALLYSTYVGGSGADSGADIAVDSSGSAYVVGSSSSSNFDSVGGLEEYNGSSDVVIFKLNPSGDALVYSTYLGGEEMDEGNGIAVDGEGAAYVTGTTDSDDFNVVEEIEGHTGIAQDVFVSKLTPEGDDLVYSTYLGGTTNDFGEDIALDSESAAYVVGTTTSTDFDTLPPQTDPPSNDAFAFKLTPAGELGYSRYLGGGGDEQGLGVAVDSKGSAYATGYTASTDFPTVNAPASMTDPGDGQTDAFVTKLDPSGTPPIYSVYLGGDDGDIGTAIAVDPSGAAYATGSTASSDLATPGAFDVNVQDDDAFVAKLTPAILPSSGGVVFSTYLGAGGTDAADGIAVDPEGAAVVAGSTDSASFPTVDPIDTSLATENAFLTRVNPQGSALTFSTRLGGNDTDQAGGVALGSPETIYVTGRTQSADFDLVSPIEGDSGGEDAFVAKISAPPPAATPAPQGPTPVPTPPRGRCAGRDVTISGTDRKDVLVGTKRADVISGLGGRDRIRGRGGADRICAGKGQDRVNAGAGKDLVLGEAGNDRLAGGGGKDILKGAGGRDRLTGGPGKRDRCSGGAGKKDRATTSCERISAVP